MWTSTCHPDKLAVYLWRYEAYKWPCKNSDRLIWRGTHNLAQRKPFSIYPKSTILVKLLLILGQPLNRSWWFFFPNVDKSHEDHILKGKQKLAHWFTFYSCFSKKVGKTQNHGKVTFDHNSTQNGPRGLKLHTSVLCNPQMVCAKFQTDRLRNGEISFFKPYIQGFALGPKT